MYVNIKEELRPTTVINQQVVARIRTTVFDNEAGARILQAGPTEYYSASRLTTKFMKVVNCRKYFFSKLLNRFKINIKGSSLWPNDQPIGAKVNNKNNSN